MCGSFQAYRFWTHRAVYLALVVAVMMMGCGPGVKPRERTESEKNLHEIYKAYKQTEMRLNRPPRSLEEIAAAFPEGQADKFLTSPNDQQPYVIVWGTSTILGPANYAQTQGTAASVPIFAYEKRGNDGKRYVLTIMGRVEVLSDEEFRNAEFPAGHKPDGS
ncbi:MAG: hypothetical protein KatS3mg105_4517 [Gemmatales bacterium]|nr:MAG: hypothetical protein KatS3mg105_4517 [Gemmatales bacterium]